MSDDTADLSTEVARLRKAIEQTIEVLEATKRLDWYSASTGLVQWRVASVSPLLDNLKALREKAAP